MRHDWIALVVTFLTAVGLNAIVFAYGYGHLANRVETLEKQRDEMRAEWSAARGRIEMKVGALENELKMMKETR